jgi:type VI secretion system protein ImpH
MAGADRRSPADLNGDLFENPSSYSFYQVVRLLRLRANQDRPIASDKFLREQLRARPHLSLGFPGTDVVDVVESIDQVRRYLVSVSFLGLYGVSSPLPTHYTEDLIREEMDDQVVARDFLDILSGPIYRLLFQTWSKYRWALRVSEEEDQDCLERLFCLVGLGSESLRRSVPRPRRLLRYLGLFSQSPRSALGLRTLLSDALEVPSLEITPCLKHWVEISADQRCRLGGQGASLGEDCYLGAQIEDRMGKIRITAGPLEEDKFYGLLPGAPLNQEFGSLMNAYLNQPMDCELKLILNPEVIHTVILGRPKGSGLGKDSWVFSGPRFEGEVAITFQC